MWQDHPFSQRNNATKKAAEVEVLCMCVCWEGEGEVLDKI